MKMRDGLLELRYNNKTGKWYKDNPTKEHPWRMNVYFLSDNVCPICKDRFFIASGNIGNVCSKSCATTKRNYIHGISEKTKINISKGNTGKRRTKEEKLKRSIRLKSIGYWSKEKNPSWKGGITSENGQFWNSQEYRNWRTSIFLRDNYTCVLCGNRGHKLEAHHILKFAENKDKRLEINNGITLCYECHHTKVHYKEHDFTEQFIDYIYGLQKHSGVL